MHIVGRNATNYMHYNEITVDVRVSAYFMCMSL